MAGPLGQGWGLGIAMRSRAALRPLGLLAPPCRGTTAPQCRRVTGSGEEVLEENPFYGKYRHKIQELRRLGRKGGMGLAERGESSGAVNGLFSDSGPIRMCLNPGWKKETK